MKNHFIPIVVTSIILSGCASVGTQISQENVEKIIVNKTTKTELLELFGKPLSQTYTSEGQLSFIWVYVYYATFGEMKQQSLIVLFNDDNTVAKYSMVDGGHDGVRLGQ